MPVCGKCGKEIRFIRRAGKKALMVNPNPTFIIPDENSNQEYVLTNGEMRKGRPALDGLKGFVFHQCR